MTTVAGRMPFRRHPVPRVQEEILRSVTGPQLRKARDVAARRIGDEGLSVERREEEQRMLAAIDREIARRVGDDDPSAIFMR